MSEQEFLQRRHTEEESVQEDAPQVNKQTVEVDSLLDEIDNVLEANASAFVQGFVQKGGQ
ncbi:MAG: ubiquitin-like protein Pup [Ancrocorticia sp.]|jgi:ubiquitin-like protein Pup|nr:ubiquitin-like protein Pup [Ancrocorticia sp.]MCI2002320.1 ubiquitin-like protein Pup [Ancrocorticia sp.]MCI2012698.1 ubiquitin-like protein Pup [Ancrocorticia sp.]MCI2177637.1 ubiquitin-like protein Pup [Ancrocorticia sp.]MCI2193614.1 ubiquitin-like protein Pup [Ancrocorticia sp.]